MGKDYLNLKIKKNDNNGIKLIKEFIKKKCIIHMEKNLTKKIIKLMILE